MKAKCVYENLNFNREGTPYEKLGIGKYVIPSVKELLKNSKWGIPSSSGLVPTKYKKWREEAMKPEKSDGYRKYTQFSIISGHITRSSSSVFEDWIDEKKKELTLKDVKDALSDLWPTTDQDAKERLISYAKRKGIN